MRPAVPGMSPAEGDAAVDLGAAAFETSVAVAGAALQRDELNPLRFEDRNYRKMPLALCHNRVSDASASPRTRRN